MVIDDFLDALIDVTEAYFRHADFVWSEQCEWIAEWKDVPVDGVVAWLQALPKDEDGLPIGADSSQYTNNDVRSILEALFRCKTHLLESNLLVGRGNSGQFYW